MIDSTLTHKDMMTLLGVQDQEELPSFDLDPLDPRFALSPSARSLLHFRTRSEVYDPLKSALRARYDAAEWSDIRRDVTHPVKRAIGNALKHGRGASTMEAPRLDFVATEGGLCIRISDFGPGFDVHETIRSFRIGAPYAHFEGSGFRTYQTASSLVSFDSEGRTFLLLWLRHASSSAAGGVLA